MTLDPNEAARSRETVDTAEHQSQIRKAVVASTIGTTIEWYDYFLYGSAAALVFPALFFPDSSEFIGQVESFTTLFVGFAARPIGAAIFGHWGDRIGRKAMLIVTLLLMGLSTAAIGLLPGTGTIGLAAPLLLVALRILQGIAVGGEWSGSVLLSMEWGDGKRRGLFASFPQLGVAIGLILSTGLLTLFSAMSGDAFTSWGWRIPFLLSLVMVAVGLYVRLAILETPVFAKAIADKKVEKTPVWQAIKRHPKEIALTAGLRMSEQMPFYVITTFVLEYLTADENGGFSEHFVLLGTMVAAATELFLVPYAGHLSDKIGRKRVYMFGAAMMGVWGFMYFGLLDTQVAWVVFLTLSLGLIPHALQYGPQAALIAESFPTSLRYGGAGLGYQLASVIAGGPAPLVAVLLVEKFGTAYAVSAYILVGSLITLACTAALTDRSKVALDDDAAYGRRSTEAAVTG